MVVWAELDPVREREQAARRPALIIASDRWNLVVDATER